MYSSWALFTCIGLESYAESDIREQFLLSPLSQGANSMHTYPRPGVVLAVFPHTNTNTDTNILQFIHSLKCITKACFLMMDQSNVPLDESCAEPFQRYFTQPSLPDYLESPPSLDLWERALHFVSIARPHLDLSSPTFRATCYRHREFKQTLNSPAIERYLGAGVFHHKKWSVDCSNPDLQLFIHVFDGSVIAGLVILGDLHRRNRSPHIRYATMLNPAVAYLMVRICRPSLGKVMWDPFCGSCTIPIEAAMSVPGMLCFASDISVEAVRLSVENVAFLRQDLVESSEENLTENSIPNLTKQLNKSIDQNLKHLQVFAADIRHIRLREVDIVCSDLPFGNRHGSKRTIKKLCSTAVHQIAQSLTKGGIACILTQSRRLLAELVSEHAQLESIETIPVHYSRLQATIHVFRRI